MPNQTPTLRHRVIRLAHSKPAGSWERRALLGVLAGVGKSALRIHGKQGPSIRALWKAFVPFVLPQTSIRIQLFPKKTLGASSGYVDSRSLQRGVAKVYFLAGDIGGAQFSLSNLGHELVHIAQYERGALSFKGADIFWKGKRFMSGAEYGALSRTDHDALPWEREAITQGKGKAAKFLANTQTLRGLDDTLDRLIDAGLF